MQDPIAQQIAQSFPQVLDGTLPAVSAPKEVFDWSKGVTQEQLVTAVESLNLGLLEAPKSGRFVLFNPQAIDEATLLEADAADELDQMAPNVVEQPGDGQQDPNAGIVGSAATPPPPPGEAAQAAMARVFPDLHQNEQARRKQEANLQPAPASQRAAPAAGQVMDMLSRRAM